MHHDFTTPEALKTFQAKKNKRERRARKGDRRNEKD